jgi:hypothetical protein
MFRGKKEEEQEKVVSPLVRVPGQSGRRRPRRNGVEEEERSEKKGEERRREGEKEKEKKTTRRTSSIRLCRHSRFSDSRTRLLQIGPHNLPVERR